MFKKAGILVAATAASLLAVSPLAFAGDKDDDGTTAVTAAAARSTTSTAGATASR